ncbi:histidine ammonia-lyase [Robiginitalea sp. M366]|uniref:histidine ammonia-lyase n=1 Tax=Robiginitalea aestuariiviva TaxID=3036903 RepID=UPI00240D35F7|nr:histidine ammonia-lyase [Robiginitalea aestuariiviva]MDG1571105.1 histidine ammonia-lyase [Robiginitalea aestuariiviva]
MPKNLQEFAFGAANLTAGTALALARGQMRGLLNPQTRKKVQQSEAIVSEIVARGKAVYGINTGFGPLCTTRISPDETTQLQFNILKSHSVGVGPPLTPEVSRLMLVLKLQALAQARSGVREQTLDRILWHLDAGVTPVVPSQGSVGASGDLAPLAHLFLPLIGLGYVWQDDKKVPAGPVLEAHGIKPLELGPKEGLALINGTQFIAAHAVAALEKMHACLAQADIIGAMMIEGLQGSLMPFHEALHDLRPYQGTRHVASRIRKLLQGSEILEDHIDCERVQDPYSLRCIPQVHGASRNAWLHLKELLEVELNAVTDNPVIIDRDLSISGGNFHGQPLAMALDYLCLAASEIGNISDRRIYLALEGNNTGLPTLLMQDTGLNSGYMILQYTSAALASENKSLCFPASADSIPTSMGQEDHVSMGSISGRKALQVLGNVEKILAIELLTAAQAFEYRKPLKSGWLLEQAHALVRKHVSFAEEDRVFAEDIEKGLELIQSGALMRLIDKTAAREDQSLATAFDPLFETF